MMKGSALSKPLYSILVYDNSVSLYRDFDCLYSWDINAYKEKSLYTLMDMALYRLKEVFAQDLDLSDSSIGKMK